MILELIKTNFLLIFEGVVYQRLSFTKKIYSVIFLLTSETKMQLSGICTFLILCPHTSTHAW